MSSTLSISTGNSISKYVLVFTRQGLSLDQDPAPRTQGSQTQAGLQDVLESRAPLVGSESLVGTHTFIPLPEGRGTACRRVGGNDYVPLSNSRWGLEAWSRGSCQEALLE